MQNKSRVIFLLDANWGEGDNNDFSYIFKAVFTSACGSQWIVVVFLPPVRQIISNRSAVRQQACSHRGGFEKNILVLQSFFCSSPTLSCLLYDHLAPTVKISMFPWTFSNLSSSQSVQCVSPLACSQISAQSIMVFLDYMQIWVSLLYSRG